MVLCECERKKREKRKRVQKREDQKFRSRCNSSSSFPSRGLGREEDESLVSRVSGPSEERGGIKEGVTVGLGRRWHVKAMVEALLSFTVAAAVVLEGKGRRQQVAGHGGGGRGRDVLRPKQGVGKLIVGHHHHHHHRVALSLSETVDRRRSRRRGRRRRRRVRVVRDRRFEGHGRDRPVSKGELD